jgi:hypothetical protein
MGKSRDGKIGCQFGSSKLTQRKIPLSIISGILRITLATFDVPDNHSPVFFTGRAPETACQHTKSGHHCPLHEKAVANNLTPHGLRKEESN